METQPHPPDPDPARALLGALGTEHFALQSAVGATIAESGSRSAIYLASLSSGLVAIGFASSSPQILAVFAFTVLPTIFLIGWFTIVRLVDTTVQNSTAQRRIERIRGYYSTLDPAAPSFFSPDDPRSTGELGIRYARWSILSTLATMIGVVNAVVGAAGLALLLVVAVGLPFAIGVSFGAILGLGLLAATLLYQRARINRVLGRAL